MALVGERFGPIGGGGGGGGGGGITDITSEDDSVTITNPEGPTVDLSVAGGGGGPQTLELSYNGAGPAECVVLKYLDYDPSVGGQIWVMLNSDLGFGEQPAQAQVDDTGTIQAMTLFNVTPGGADISSQDAAGDNLPLTVAGLVVATTSGNPGDDPNDTPAFQGMVLMEATGPTPTIGSLWVCTSSAPGATWSYCTATPG